MDWTMAFGMLSILFALLNAAFTFMRKDSRVFMFASLSLTILTLYAACMNDKRIIDSMGFDRDILSAHIFLDLGLISIAVNSIGLFGMRKRK